MSAQLSRFKILEDGRDPDQRRTGKTWKKFGLIFGEQFLYKSAGTKGRRNDAEQRMHYGRYIGHHNRHGSVMVLTPTGVKIGSSYTRLQDGREDKQAGQTEGWKELRGLPWDVTPRNRSGHMSATAFNAGEPASVESGDTASPLLPPTPVQPIPPRGTFPVQKKYVEKYGSTIGCDGCNWLKVGIQSLRAFRRPLTASLLAADLSLSEEGY